MKLLRYLVMGALTACMSMPIVNSVEAATVALLPLINNVADRDDLGSIYYDRAVEATKIVDGYEIVDNDALDKAIAKNLQPNTLPTQAACEAIAAEANVDYVLMMQVDKLFINQRYGGPSHDYVLLNLNGRYVAYDAITGKYINKRIMEEKRAVAAQMARYDISGSQFGDSVTRETKRALSIKKVTFAKPRIGSLKGDKR